MANKFKTDDYVQLTKEVNALPIGSVGKICGYVSSNYAVDFGKLLDGAGHECDGLLPSGTGLFIPVTYLELADKPIPRVVVEFDSVIMADEKRNQILEALEQINQHDLIFKTWGFGSTIEKGKGVSMLFYGPPGTGKTLTAQAIAHKLSCKLKILSVADIESSEPGKAERNIRKHFKEAKGGKTILLFDECDSLIYTRQNVGPILGAQINELLSQIERFDGVTIFTTNRLGTLDEAVNRRLALKLEFDMPTPEERSLIWQRMFPKEAPLDADIDWLRLASVEITGGYIKNAVLRAARMAAIQKLDDKDKKITMEHLIKSLTLEATSMLEFDKARKQNNFGGWIPAEALGTTSNADNERTIHKVLGASHE